METFVRAASVGELSDGEIKLVEVGEERVLLSNVGGDYHAVSEVSPHEEGPLSEGYVEGTDVECPWHGSLFDLKTGRNTGAPASVDLATFAVRVEGDDIMVGPAG